MLDPFVRLHAIEENASGEVAPRHPRQYRARTRPMRRGARARSHCTSHSRRRRTRVPCSPINLGICCSPDAFSSHGGESGRGGIVRAWITFHVNYCKVTGRHHISPNLEACGLSQLCYQRMAGAVPLLIGVSPVVNLRMSSFSSRLVQVLYAALAFLTMGLVPPAFISSLRLHIHLVVAIFRANKR